MFHDDDYLGSPILYYGDEILMGDNIYLPDRNGVRTPMQWDETKPHAGFSTAKKIYTPIVQSKEYGPDRVNVKVEIFLIIMIVSGCNARPFFLLQYSQTHDCSKEITSMFWMGKIILDTHR